MTAIWPKLDGHDRGAELKKFTSEDEVRERPTTHIIAIRAGHDNSHDNDSNNDLIIINTSDGPSSSTSSG